MKKAVIRTAGNMSEETLGMLERGIAEKFGGEIEFETAVDEALIGGFILNFDGTVYDMSVASQLSELEKHIKG